MEKESEQSGINPFWCVAASIVEERVYGPSGSWRSSGTKHFRPGAKIYIVSSYWGMGSETVTVVGRHRRSHCYITIDLAIICLTKLRVELVYSLHVIKQIAANWHMYKRSGGSPSENDMTWGGSEECKNTAEERKILFESVIDWIQRELEVKQAASTMTQPLSEM
jgi:hypothetical protein